MPTHLGKKYETQYGAKLENILSAHCTNEKTKFNNRFVRIVGDYQLLLHL